MLITYINQLLEKSCKTILLFIIHFYQNYISAKKGYHCAYHQHHDGLSCSAHAKNVLENQPLTTALSLIYQRRKDCSQVAKLNGMTYTKLYHKSGLVAVTLAGLTGCSGGGGDDNSTTTTQVEPLPNNNVTNAPVSTPSTSETNTPTVENIEYATGLGIGYGASSNTCSGIESSGNPYPCCTNTIKSYGSGNCTWYAAYQANKHWGDSFYELGSLGNARDWATTIQTLKTGKYKNQPNHFVHKLAISDTPVKNSIYVKQTGAYGHVAWVETIDENNKNKFYVKEQNCFHDGNKLLHSSFPQNQSNNTRSNSYHDDNNSVFIYLKDGDSPTIHHISGNPQSIEVNQTVDIMIKAEDKNADLDRIDLNWNDGSAIESIKVELGQVATFSKTFNKPTTIHWSSTAYDKKGNVSNMIQNSFEVVEVQNTPPYIDNLNVSINTLGFKGSFNLYDKENHGINNLTVSVKKANTSQTCTEKINSYTTGYQAFNVCGSLLSSQGNGDYIISILGEDTKGASITKNSYTLNYENNSHHNLSCLDSKGNQVNSGSVNVSTKICPVGQTGSINITKVCQNGTWVNEQHENNCRDLPSIQPTTPIYQPTTPNQPSTGTGSTLPTPTPPVIQRPILEGGVHIQRLNDTTFSLNSRTASGQVDYYELWRSNSAGYRGSKISQSSSNYFQDSPPIGQTVYYTIGVCNTSGCSYSNQDYGKIELPKPQLSGGVHIQRLANGNGFSLNSRVGTNVEYYALYRSTYQGSKGTYLGRSQNNYFTDYNVQRGITYYYTISACNASGCVDSEQHYAKF